MSETEIMTLPAGRELDAQIAHRVFGFDAALIQMARDGLLDAQPGDARLGYRLDEVFQPDPPCYSADIAAAWELVRVVIERWGEIELNGVPDGWTCFIGGDLDTRAENCPTAPLAICRAALLAVSQVQSPR